MAFRNLSVILSANTNNFRSQMINAGRSVDLLDAHIKKASTTSAGAALAFKTTGLVAGVVLAAGLALSAKKAVEFERSMRNVNSISRLSEYQLGRLSQQVIQLSRVTPQSANNLAQALYDIASAGKTGADGFKVLQASAMAASAGLTTAKNASTGILAVLNAYGLGADKAAAVSDTLFKTVELGIVTFEQISTQIGDFIGMAAIMEVPLEHVTAAFASMTLAGLPAAEAAVSMNRVLRSLIKPSDEMAVAMDRLGINMETLKDPADGLYGAFVKLGAEAQGNIKVIQSWFPEIRAFRGAVALMTAEGRTYARIHGEMSDATARDGATQRAFNEQMKAVGNQWTLFMNKVNAAAIILGTNLLPILSDMMVAMERLGANALPVLNAAFAAMRPLFTALGDIFSNVVDIAKDMADAFGPTVAVLASIAGGAVIGSLTLLAQALAAISGFLAENEQAAKALALIFGGFLVSQMLSAVVAMKSVQAAVIGVRTAIATMATLAALYKTIGVGGTAKALASGIAGIATSATVASAAFLALAYTMVSAWNNAKKAGDEYGKTVISNIDAGDYSSHVRALDTLKAKYTELNNVASVKTGLSSFAEGFVDLVVPFHNVEDSVVDVSRAMDGLEPHMEKLAANMMQTKLVADQLGTSESTVLRFMNALNIDFDGTPYQEVAIAVKDAMTFANAGAVGLENMAAAQAVLADATASSGAQLSAWNDLAEATINLSLNAFDAQTSWAGALLELGTSLRDNGTTMDEYTEKGQANRKAASAAAQAALDHASAVAAEEGSLAAGNEALSQHVAELHEVWRQGGMTEQQIQDLTTAIGLTPENLAILVESSQIEGATTALQKTKEKAEELGRLKIEPRISLNGAIYAQIAAVEARLKAIGGTVPTLGSEHLSSPRGAYGPARATGGIVSRNQSYLVGERGPELVEFHGNGVVRPAHDPRSKAAAAGAIPMANGGAFGWRSSATTTAARVASGISSMGEAGAATKKAGEEAEKAAKKLEDLNKEIAKNRQEWFLANISLEQRIFVLGQLIGKEQAFTDEWMRLTEAKAEAEKTLADESEEFLKAHFERRIELAKNYFQAGMSGPGDYIALLDEAIAAEEKYTDRWVDLQSERMDAVNKEMEDFRNLQDNLKRIGIISNQAYEGILRERLASTEQFSDEWFEIWDKLNAGTERKMQEQNDIVDHLAGVWVDSMKEFEDQNVAYAKAIEERGERVTEALKDAYDSIAEPIREAGDLIGTFGSPSSAPMAGEVEGFLAHRIEAVKRFQKALQELSKKGYQQDFLDQLTQAGPEALGLAESLQAVDPSIVNDAMLQINGVGDSLARLYTERSRAAIQAKVDAEVQLPAMRSFNDILNKNLDASRKEIELREEAIKWAKGMVEGNGALTTSYSGVIIAIEATISALRRLNDLRKEEGGGGGGGGGGYGFPGVSGGAGPQTGSGLYAVDGGALVRTLDGSVVPVSSYGFASQVGTKYLVDGNTQFATLDGGTVSAPGYGYADKVASYDQGGYLPVGYSVAYNGTGRPEPVGHHLSPSFSLGDVSIAVGSGNPTDIRAAVEAGMSSAFSSVVGRLQQGVKR